MNYYKLIVDGKIVDVMSDPVWVKMGRNGRPVRCSIKDACGVLSRNENTIFQIGSAPVMSQDYDVVGIADIAEAEYDELKAVLELDGMVQDETNTIQWPKEPKPVEETNHNLMSVIERKIDIMRGSCRDAIMAGMDVTLSSGEVKHFDLTMEGQINLWDAQNQIAAGATVALYKAEGEPLSYYAAADIQAIATAAAEHKTRHRAYFESLRRWIMASKTIVEAGNRFYGEDIPEKFWSEVYKTLM